MARNLGIPGGQVPSAVRTSSPGWRDPRLWVGVAIVAASVLVGVRVLASADDTVQVWAVVADVAPGQKLAEDDLEPRRLRFADGEDLERYYEVGDELPEDLTVAREVGAGELLARSAVGALDDGDTVTVSLAVTPLLVPSGIRQGSVVNVYVTGDLADTADTADTGAEARDAGTPALEEVRVVAVAAADASFSTSGDRQVELAVPADEVSGFYSLLDRLNTPTVSLTQVS